MNTLTGKTQENNNKSVSNRLSQIQVKDESNIQLLDSRPEVVLQRKLQDLANNSPQVSRLKLFQEMADNRSDKYNGQIQRKENNTGLPNNLKMGMENLSGMSLNDVKVHRNSDKPAQLQAHAYAQGNQIYLGPSQDKYLPHEAWHVVQQKQGRVQATTQMKGQILVNDDTGLEKEADEMGAKAVQMAPKEDEEIPIQRKAITNSEVVQLNPFSWFRNLFRPKNNKVAPVALIPETFNSKKIGFFREIIKIMEYDWIKVKDHYKKAMSNTETEPDPKIFEDNSSEKDNSLEIGRQMTSLLDYREYTTIKPDNPESTMRKAKDRILGKVKKESGENDDDYVQWDAEGSKEPTSDIDVNIMGRRSEEASEYAFEIFRNEWKKESGQVFDVNFYARDWKPNNLKNGLVNANDNYKKGMEEQMKKTDEENNISLTKDKLDEIKKETKEKLDKIKNVTKDQLKGTVFEGKGNAEEAKEKEKIYSIAKLIRDMKNLDPSIKKHVKNALVKEGDIFADKAWAGGEREVTNWENAVKVSGSGKDSRAKKENLAYANATKEVANYREMLNNTRIEIKDKEYLEDKLLAARLKAAFYGPEAYVTEAAFIHGVINKQMQSTTFKNSIDKKHKVNIKLDNDELLQVVIENVGFAFHHVNELSDGNKETEKMGYDTVAKYIYRACNALKHMGVEEFKEISTLAKNTVLKKKNIKKSKESLNGEVEVKGLLNEKQPSEINNILIRILKSANDCNINIKKNN